MYQVPVQKLERIRTSRKRVKEILTDIGLDSCRDLLKELKGFDAGQHWFDSTDWEDLTDCNKSKRRKKWCYRSQSLCCSLCWFSTRSWFTFRSHVQRCHEEEQDLASLSPCSRCSYISRPALLHRHTKLFHSQTQGGANNNISHSKTPVSSSQVGVRVSKPGVGGDKFSCARCGFHDSLLYVIRKHVLVSHCETLLQRYYGRRSASSHQMPDNTIASNSIHNPDANPPANGVSLMKTPDTATVAATNQGFYCCVCGMPAETSEHLLYHLLSSDKHRELNCHINPLLVEHCNSNTKNNTTSAQLPQLAPRTLQQVVSLVSKAKVSRKPLPSQGAVLLARPPQTTALVCSATGGRQILLANQNAAAVATRPITSPSPATPISLLLPSGVQSKQLPLTVTVPGPGQPQPQQVLLPPGVTLNLAGKIGAMGRSGQPLFLTQGQGGKIGVKVSPSQPVVLTQGQGGSSAGHPNHTLIVGGKVNPSQPVVLTQGQSGGSTLTGPAQTLLVGGKLGGSQPVVLTQGKTPSVGAVGPSQPLVVGTKVSSSQTMIMNQGLPLQSQSTVRLVPTGNKVNGVPTYTLATVQLAVPVQPDVAMTTLNKPSILVAVPQQTSQTQSVAGQNKAALTKQNSGSVSGTGHAKELVTKSQYLVRTTSGTVRCSCCKVLLSDKGIFQHLLHGLQCLFCPLIFYSLKQLLAHNEAEHSLAEAGNRERAKTEHQLATTEDGRIVVPAFNMKTTVPRDLLGCKELQLAVVTGRGKEVLYLHLSEEPSKAPTPSIPSSGCPFCPEQPVNPAMYEQHLRQHHHILPTIHAILKTPAFKCVYCLGVYTDRSTAKTISIHVQRCRCAPRSAKEAERLLNPDTHCLNGEAGGAREGGALSSWGKGRPGTSRDPCVTFALEPPAGLELRPPEERKYFLGQYFNKKPYPSRKETELLAGRLKLSRTEVLSLFGSKQKRCLLDCQTRQLQVLLGFDTSQLRSLKHNLDLPGMEEGLESDSEEATRTKPHSDHLYAGRPSPDSPPTRQVNKDRRNYSKIQNSLNQTIKTS
ncbi:activity-dependent neuroprotective protein 2a [Centroberyx gerrardi]|uniref:activity-dependent neuroprotective protein 2a-like n=1 Tax=Centroberyx gerrardi TaxID=166262 RepID=UPI003AADB9CA